jgi:hypothetical protein
MGLYLKAGQKSHFLSLNTSIPIQVPKLHFLLLENDSLKPEKNYEISNVFEGFKVYKNNDEND